MNSRIIVFAYCIVFLITNAVSVFSQTEEQLLEQLNNTTNDSVKIDLLMDLTDIATYSNPKQASKYVAEAIIIITSRNLPMDFELAKCYNRASIISTMQGKFVEAIENYQKALNIFELLLKNNPDNQIFFKGMVNVYGNIGTIYYHQKNYHTAIKYWEKSVNMLNKPEFDFSKALLLNNIGVAYHETKTNDTALIYYQKALNIFQILNSKKNIAMCYTNIGEVYSEEGIYLKAIDFLQKSLKIKEKIEDNHGLSNCLISLSGLSFNMGNFEESKKYAERAVIISQNTDNLTDLREAYKLLAQNHKALGEYKQAYSYHQNFKIINDSIFNKESNDKFIEMQSKYESEKKENELQLFKQKEKNQELIKRTLVSGIIIIILISFLIIRSIILKKKNEKKLFMADKEIKEKEAILMHQELEKKELVAKELSYEIDYKSKQLTTHALNMMQKNKMLHNLISDIDEISKQAKPEVKGELRKLKTIVKKNIRNENDWDTFKLYFEQINKGFYNSLIKINSTLNAHDLRHCALIKLNLNVKEAASVLNLSPNTVKSARYRIKKKLLLKPEDDLIEFIRDI